MVCEKLTFTFENKPFKLKTQFKVLLRLFHFLFCLKIPCKNIHHGKNFCHKNLTLSNLQKKALCLLNCIKCIGYLKYKIHIFQLSTNV